MRSFRAKPVDVGRARSRSLAARFGTELRLARMTAGLTQRQLARRAMVTQQEVSRVERGNERSTLETRCRLAAACGAELGWRLYPNASVSLRDSGQLRLAQAIVRAAHPRWTPRLEVPVGNADLRAADIVLESDDEVLHIEVERTLVDFQAQLRAAQLKRESLAAELQRPVRLVIAVPDTRAVRARVGAVCRPPARKLAELSEKHLGSSSRNVGRRWRTGSCSFESARLLSVRVHQRRRLVVRRRGTPATRVGGAALTS